MINFTKYEILESRVIQLLITNIGNLEYLQVKAIVRINLLLFEYFLILNDF